MAPAAKLVKKVPGKFFGKRGSRKKSRVLGKGGGGRKLVKKVPRIFCVGQAAPPPQKPHTCCHFRGRGPPLFLGPFRGLFRGQPPIPSGPFLGPLDRPRPHRESLPGRGARTPHSHRRTRSITQASPRSVPTTRGFVTCRVGSAPAFIARAPAK